MYFVLISGIYPVNTVYSRTLPSEPENRWMGVVSVLGETGCTSFRLDAKIVPDDLVYMPIEETWRLVIPVSAFKARFRLIEKDFNDMVRGKDYPEIIIKIPLLKGKDYPFPVEIWLAGKTIHTVVVPKITQDDMKAADVLQGETSINWKKLGLVPPRRFGNICEVHNTIMITFALTMTK